MSKVIVGISGGVDSAVTAYLLKQKGYEVIGMTMVQFDGVPFLDDAKAVCDFLGIKLVIKDMRKPFKENVEDYFVSSYYQGLTPNPCNMCNPKVKFQSLMEVMADEGADFIATGHYARVEAVNGRFSVKNSETASKDQTYALCFLTQEQLSHTIMPLGDYSKDEIRKIALEAKLPVATKSDSQDICFIPDGDYAKYLEKLTGKKDVPGNFVDKEGKILGRHEGITHYTIGQRKGLNLAMGYPVFVTDIDVPKNEVVIGSNDDLFTTDLKCDNVNFMCGDESKLPIELTGKIRYAHKGSTCTFYKDEENNYRCKFSEPVRAITPGQTLVLYDKDFVFAGARIIK